MQDIEKYGILSLIIDEYNEIEEILEAIYKQYMSYKILISGSAHDYSEYGTEEEAKELIYELGYNLVKQDQGYGLKVINGNGFGVGPSLYEGIAEATALNDLDMADYLKLYPRQNAALFISTVLGGTVAATVSSHLSSEKPI